MNLGQKVETSNPASVLRGETGLFRLWEPTGLVGIYRCTPTRSLHFIGHEGVAAPRSAYLVEKVAELTSEPIAIERAA